MVNARGKCHISSDAQAKATRLLDGTFATHTLDSIPSFGGSHRIGFSVAPRLPQRRPNIAWTNGVDPDTVLCLVDGQGLAEGGRRTLGGRVGDSLCLAERTDKAAHVDDVALGLSQMRQCLLTNGKVADEIQLEQILHVSNAKVIDGTRRWVPSSIIDDAVQPTKLFDGLSDYIDALVDIGYIRLHKHRSARMTVVGVEFGLQLLAFVYFLVTEYDVGTRRQEDTDAALTNSHGTARYHRHLANVTVSQPNGEGLYLGRYREIRSRGFGNILLAKIGRQNDARRGIGGTSSPTTSSVVARCGLGGEDGIGRGVMRLVLELFAAHDLMVSLLSGVDVWMWRRVVSTSYVQ